MTLLKRSPNEILLAGLKQIRTLYAKSNKIIRTFSHCTIDVKLLLSRAIAPLFIVDILVYRPGYFTVHPPPRLQVDQNFLTQKIVADPKMRCHQKSFGIWRVTEAILGQKTCFFSKNIFWKKFIINHTIFLIFRYAFFLY